MDELAPLVFLVVAVVLWAVGRGVDRLLRRSGLSEGWRLLVVAPVLLFLALVALAVGYLFFGPS